MKTPHGNKKFAPYLIDGVVFHDLVLFEHVKAVVTNNLIRTKSFDVEVTDENIYFFYKGKINFVYRESDLSSIFPYIGEKQGLTKVGVFNYGKEYPKPVTIADFNRYFDEFMDYAQDECFGIILNFHYEYMRLHPDYNSNFLPF